MKNYASKKYGVAVLRQLPVPRWTSIVSNMANISEYSRADDDSRAAMVVGALIAKRSAHRKIVVVFGLGSYGDALQITPLLGAIRDRFRDSFVVLVHASPLARTILDSCGNVDFILSAPSTTFSFIRHEIVNRGLADLIVNCRYAIEYILPPPSALTGDEREFVLHAQLVQKDWLPLTARFPQDNDLLWQEAARRGLNAYSLMALTSGFPDRDFEALRFAIAPEDRQIRRNLPDRYYLVNNSAETLTLLRGGWTKTLPRRKISLIVEKLKPLGIPSVLFGTADDPSVDGVDYDWRGRSTLGQAAALIQGAVFWLAPEGGATNLGQAVGKPGIVFFASTPHQFFAFRNNINLLPRLCGGCWWTTPSYLYQCPRLHRVPECGASIGDEEVLAAARRLSA